MEQSQFIPAEILAYYMQLSLKLMGAVRTKAWRSLLESVFLHEESYFDAKSLYRQNATSSYSFKVVSWGQP